MYSVSKQWNDYSLRGKPIIDSLRLAKENYNDALFIHPPFFVYTSAFLHCYLSVPLPIIPLIFHFATAAMIPIILSCILRDSVETPKQDTLLNLNLRTSYSAMAVKAMVVFLCCPIAAFCSQKFWIDNALLMTTTVAATVHMLLCGADTYSDSQDQGRATSLSKSVGNQILSGFVFGFIALNTKITALALLPFLLCWTVFHRLEVVLNSNQRACLSLLADIITHIGAFVVSAAVSYSPWIYLYWVRKYSLIFSLFLHTVYMRVLKCERIWTCMLCILGILMVPYFNRLLLDDFPPTHGRRKKCWITRPLYAQPYTSRTTLTFLPY